MIFTNSQLKTFLRCPQQYHYKWGRKILPKRSTIPLKRGSWLHELLEAHYTTGDWRKRHEELTKEFNSMFEEEREWYGPLPEVCGAIMESYEYYWREEDSQLEVIAAEQVVHVPTPHHHTFEFKFDLIVEDEFGRWLVEHKSHKTLPDDDYRFMDVQTSRYVWGLNKLGTYGQIQGLLWNYLRTKPPTKPPQLKTGGISLAKRYDTDLLTFTRAVIEYGLNPRDYRDKILALKGSNTFFKRVRVPIQGTVVKTLMKEAVLTADHIDKGFTPVRVIDRSCQYSCSYMQLCMTELYGGDAKEMQKALYRPATSEDYYGYGDQTEAEN